jgi:HSP20 family molecular chaperone IbpA
MQMEIEKRVLTLQVCSNRDEREGGSSSERVGPTTRKATERSRVCVKRSIMLPAAADTSSSKTSYENGMLTIRFPKKALVGASTQLSTA